MSLIERKHYLNSSARLLANYPVLAILGPRQCGKTTFVREFFPQFDYLDLELPSDLAKLENDPELFLSSRSKPLVVDEAQRLPELFPVLRALVDRDRNGYGRFVLLGSASFGLHKRINESLSGRVGFLDFNPFHLRELGDSLPLETMWLKGGFPDALLKGEDKSVSFEWFEFYTRTLIERDLPSLGIDVNSRQFRLLWQMAAHFHGEVLNKNKIASSLGVSPHTVDRYLSILEQTFALRLLPPFFSNIKKRLVKSPKLYFRDSGMFHYFTGIHNMDSLVGSPRRGDSFEGLLVEQIAQMLGPHWNSYFFRTADGLEVDLLLTKGARLVPIEIKSKLSVEQNDYRSIEKTLDLLGQDKGFLVNLGSDTFPLSKRVKCVGATGWLKDGCPPFWEL